MSSSALIIRIPFDRFACPQDHDDIFGHDPSLGHALKSVRATPVFTRQVLDLLSDEDYRKLQTALVNRPLAGSVIKGSGGLRKIRRTIEGRGKRGGAASSTTGLPRTNGC